MLHKPVSGVSRLVPEKMRVSCQPALEKHWRQKLAQNTHVERSIFALVTGAKLTLDGSAGWLVSNCLRRMMEWSDDIVTKLIVI